MGDAARDLVEALLEVGGDGEHVAGVAQRHLLAQIDAELVVVGRVERRDAADALRPEAGAGAIGGAGVERDADDGRVVLADIADVLDVGRLEEGVDAGEMRQLAAREGRDRLVGQAVGAGQPHVERPLLLLAPALLGQLCPRPPAPSSPGCRACRSPGGAGALGRRRGREPGLARAPGGSIEDHAAAPSGSARAAGAADRLGEPEQRDGAAAGEVEVVGDDGAEALLRLRVGSRHLSNTMSRVPSAKPSLMSWVTIRMVIPCARHSGANQLVHLHADAGVERAERLVEQQHAAACGPAPGRWRAAAACRPTARSDTCRRAARDRPRSSSASALLDGLGAVLRR